MLAGTDLYLQESFKVPCQGGRAVQSSHLPFGLAGPLNSWHWPQAVPSAPRVKKAHPLQVLAGSGDFSV
jgi:hypothetical protein